LIVCGCGHDIDEHDPGGCNTNAGGMRCDCRFGREAVLERVLALEREEIRRQWLPEGERKG